jgi:alkaline phosphatase D
MLNLTHGPLVGATTDQSVHIWLRADGAGEAEIRLFAAADPLQDAGAKRAKAWLQSRQDYTAVFTINELQPDTTYHYTLFLNGQPALDQEFEGQTTFRTFPSREERASSFSFTFGSCFVPEFHADAIFNNLAADRDFDPRFFLMIGDNVYVDKYIELHSSDPAPAAESLLELYRAAYRESWGYPNFRRALAQTPSFMIFDDHEIWDNWNNEAVHQHDREGLPAAKQSYWEYQDCHNPYARARHGTSDPTYYYTFEYGSDIGFFVLDCRMRRNPEAIPYPTILGDEQRQALYKWLGDNKGKYRLKFIVSSVPISFIALPHTIVQIFHGKLGDQWLGYPQERLELFKFIHHEDIQGVHFLSGDIHLGQGLVIKSAAEAPGPTVYSYTSSPLANNFHLLPNEIPTWFSTSLWLLFGAAVGLFVAGQLARITWPWGLVGGLVLGLAAAWLWQRVRRGRDPLEKEKVGRFDKMLYKILRWIAHRAYLRKNMGVAADVIKGGGVHYVPDNLFTAVHDYNMGVVNVERQDDGGLTVQFKLVDKEGDAHESKEEPHSV